MKIVMAQKIQKIPYGMTDLEVIIREGYYYVDKTRFIRDLEEEGSYVFFLRPRRYGKSLTIAMLNYYYNIKYADRFEAIFGGLDIGKEPTDKHNTYLVLSLNFSKVNSDRDKVQQSFDNMLLQDLANFAHTYKALLPSDTEEEVKKRTDSNDAFNYLCDQVMKTDRKMYVLIDEYDNFANTLMSYDEEAYSELTHGDGFFRLFFNSLKAATTGADAPVDRLYISGVSPLTLSDVTSGFNIGDNFSLMPYYNELIGFTEHEVREMLQYYHDATGQFRHTVDELVEVMRPWYDNNCFSSYCVGASHMYNSDMVLYFIKKYMMSLYHIPEQMMDPNAHSDYDRMRKMIKFDRIFGEKAETLQKIINDGYVETSVKPEFSLSELYEARHLPSLLFYMGMLTYGKTPEGDTALVVPNLVVRELYYRYMNECYTENLQWKTELGNYIDLGKLMAKKGDGEPLLRYLAEQMRENSSTRDFDVKAESFVKGFMLAKLGGMVSYFISQTEPDMDHGYADLYLEPWTENTSHAYVIELKYCNADATDGEVEKKRKEAVAQANQYIEAKQLLQRATVRGWTLHRFAIVFRSWKLMVCEEIK